MFTSRLDAGSVQLASDRGDSDQKVHQKGGFATGMAITRRGASDVRVGKARLRNRYRSIE